MKTKFIILMIILILPLAGFAAWAYTPLGPSADALAALQTDAGVQVSRENGWYVFTPRGEIQPEGLIFYPGGRVDARSYAPLLRAVATHGYRVVLVPMPFNLAVFAPDRAAEVMAAFPEVDAWAVGGHSLGGAMAAAFVFSQPGAANRLVLWAAYPAQNNDLSRQDIPVLSVYAGNDGLATREKIEASRPLLPQGTRWVEITGGNHAGFGSYGSQPGDGTANIPAAQQLEEIVAATVTFLSGE